MEPLGSVVVVGSSNTDLVVDVRAIPRPGETVLGGDLRQAQGGKGANQAVAARRAGAAVAFVGCLGDDRFGDAALAALAAEGIATGAIRRVHGVPSGVALISVAAGGENAIVVAPGANARLAPDDIERARPAFAAATIIVAQLEVPLAAVERAFALAREHGATTLLNPAPAPTDPLPAALLALTDLLVCNESEAEALSGVAAGDAAGAAEAARALLALGPRRVILTRGGAGYTLADGAEVRQARAFAVPVVDTTAAGDAFIGALAARLASGDAADGAARYAAAAAALSVQTVGAQPSLTSAAAISAFLRARSGGV
jgi:ribokinase